MLFLNSFEGKISLSEILSLEMPLLFGLLGMKRELDKAASNKT
jgi:hypothetical protein